MGLLVGGCAIVASAGVGIVQDVHMVPEAKGKTNVVGVHVQQPHNHTHLRNSKWHLSKIYTLNHLAGS